MRGGERRALQHLTRVRGKNHRTPKGAHPGAEEGAAERSLCRRSITTRPAPTSLILRNKGCSFPWGSPLPQQWGDLSHRPWLSEQTPTHSLAKGVARSRLHPEPDQQHRGRAAVKDVNHFQMLKYLAAFVK